MADYEGHINECNFYFSNTAAVDPTTEVTCFHDIDVCYLEAGNSDDFKNARFYCELSPDDASCTMNSDSAGSDTTRFECKVGSGTNGCSCTGSACNDLDRQNEATSPPSTLELIVTTSSPTTAIPTTAAPTSTPTTNTPTQSPTTSQPTSTPTDIPSSSPTKTPTESPTKQPSSSPTNVPTQPSLAPSMTPTTSIPTGTPSASPTTPIPTKNPLDAGETHPPTEEPTTATPTETPTKLPTATPTTLPSKIPTKIPTPTPTDAGGVVDDDTSTTIDSIENTLGDSDELNVSSTALEDWVYICIGAGSLCVCIVTVIMLLKCRKYYKRKQAKEDDYRFQVNQSSLTTDRKVKESMDVWSNPVHHQVAGNSPISNDGLNEGDGKYTVPQRVMSNTYDDDSSTSDGGVTGI